MQIFLHISKKSCTFAHFLRNISTTLRLSRNPYYRDRLTEDDLCYDFPGDEIFIRGLHSMQTHFRNNNVPVDIPIIRVMNSAHFMAAYMFSTQCSGDQVEYDVMAYSCTGRDKNLYKITIIVLAAMLKRTKGLRAKQCHNLLLDNRYGDFEDGISLYDRFLQSAEQHFAEENFLIDTHVQIQKLIAANEQLLAENQQLKYTITTMEAQTNIQYKQDNNQGTIYNAPVYQYYYTQPVAEPTRAESVADTPSAIPPDFFCISSRFPEEDIRRRLAAELSQSTSKVDYCRALYRLQHMGCIDINQYASDAKRAIVFNEYQNRYTLSPSDFSKARNTK